ncbi:DUF2341 domain-containing protein, partial [candidate division WWE3 bacterium]|nr:DUF2341 domain-containing protein [candidate division WWE3 bacterium]
MRNIKLLQKPTRRRILSVLAMVGSSLLMVGLVFLSLNNEASAGWWNEGWQYRIAIPVSNNTTEESDVYINFTGGDAFDTSDSSKFQTDCGDMRFTNAGGNILPHYIVSGCGTSSTVVHVHFGTFPAGDMTIYLYYGNSSAEDGGEGSDFSTEASNYTIGTAGSEEVGPGPVAYWSFDEGYGSTAKSNVVKEETVTTSVTLSPSTLANEVAGTYTWTNPNDAASSNDVNAYVYKSPPGLGFTSYYLKATDFGFSIPSSATIDGIEVNVEKS